MLKTYGLKAMAVRATIQQVLSPIITHINDPDNVAVYFCRLLPPFCAESSKRGLPVYSVYVETVAPACKWKQL